MMQRIIYVLLLTIVLLLTGCNNDDQPTAGLNSQVAVTLFATMDNKSVAQGRGATRTPNKAINNNPALSDKGGFGVFACYTGLHKYGDSNVHPDFMYNEHVTGNTDGSVWTYTPLKYWPNGEGDAAPITGIVDLPHYVSFMAYAPYSDNSTGDAGYCIPSFSLQGEIGNPWLTYRIANQTEENPDDFLNQQVDLLYAPALLDQTRPNDNSHLLFQFDHALACVGDKVTIKCSEGIKNQLNSRISSTISNAKVVVTSITIEYTLTSKARLILWNNGEANWQTILSEEPTCKRVVTILSHSDNPDNGIPVDAYSTSKPSEFTLTDTWIDKGVFYIPVELAGYAQTATVSITHRMATLSGSTWRYDTEKMGTASINLKDYSEAYLPGKHLYINITLNQVDIALTAAIAPWTEIVQEVEGIEE